ncbi:MAG TPA: glycosyltransferase family 4 protein [Pyrinomonadaceae bacterium]|nr:glycosyltransferase family 4 protein [Pyrinomonadaceae bacterium]
MIRVLHFASVINRYDFIDTVLTGLDRSRFEVAALTVVPPNNRTGAYSDDERYETQCLDIPFERRNYPMIYRGLRAKIREFRPHILQAHHYDETVLAAFAAKQSGVPAFVIGHQYSDHIYVLTKGLKRKAYLFVERLCNSYADRIVVPTQEVVDLLVSQGVKPEKILKNPYGTDLGMVDDASQVEIDKIRSDFGLNEKFVALTCCRLNKEKGLDHLLQAVPAIKARHPHFKLAMVGTGAYEARLKEICTELNIDDAVVFVGWRKDSYNWYSLADVVIQPSLAESFCQVVTEALAFKKPIVVTPVGIAPEVIISGERGGYLVEIGSSRDIENAVCSLIADAGHRALLGETGFEFVSSILTVEATAERYEELYSDIIETRLPDLRSVNQNA